MATKNSENTITDYVVIYTNAHTDGGHRKYYRQSEKEVYVAVERTAKAEHWRGYSIFKLIKRSYIWFKPKHEDPKIWLHGQREYF